MITKQDVQLAVSKLFNPKWLCLVDREYLAMLRETPAEVNLTATEYTQSGFNPSNGVTRTETNPNMAGIIDMLWNNPRITTDQQNNPEMNLLGSEMSYLSSADMAELIYKNGRIQLVNPIDSVEIHENIGVYLNQIDLRKQLEPHYKSPPEEDIAAFTKLYNILDGLASGYTSLGSGNAALAELISLTTMNTTMLIATKKPTMEIDGRSARAEVGLHFRENKDPYKYNNR